MAIRIYAADMEVQMKSFYDSLSECDRRRYAGVEASKLGHGGIEYIADVLGCDPKTVRRGQAELLNPPDLPAGRVRKKELLGTYYRDGQLYTLDVQLVFDHDFAHAAKGVILPHSLYDLKRNLGHLYLGLSHDTSEFACDNVYRWWQTYGRVWYPQATSILLLCDSGGSNDYRRYVFKEQLQRLAERLQLEVRVAHYPPYTSKYNPIEHRLFPHVTRACQGVIFDQLSTVVELMQKTRTRQGLRVTVRVIKKFYATGQTCSAEFKAAMPIRFDEDLPQWNYRAVPTLGTVSPP